MNRHLLIVTESYARGGGNRYMIDLVNAVADDFRQVSFVANPGGIYAEDLARSRAQANVLAAPILTRDGFAGRLSGLPIAQRRLFALGLLLAEPLFMVLNIWLFWRLFRRLRPSHILCCNGGYPASAACLAAVIAARLYGTPAVLTIVSMPSRRRWYFWLYDAALDALVWRTCQIVIANARAISAALEATRGLPRNGAVVLHNGIDDIPISAEPPRTDAVVIGCIARLDKMKGALVLLDAFSELCAGRDDLRLVLAGDGDASAEIASRIRARHLENKVTLLGHFSGDVSDLLGRFDIFVFPSLWEGFPYSIIEAMRSGCAIVATRVGGIPEAISDGREGLLVDAGAAPPLAAAIRRMLDDEDLRNSCANAARSRFEREFSLSEMHRRTREIIMGIS